MTSNSHCVVYDVFCDYFAESRTTFKCYSCTNQPGVEDEKGDGTTHVLDESTRLVMKWPKKKGDRFITKRCSKATCGGKSGVGLEQQKEEKRRGPKKRIR